MDFILGNSFLASLLLILALVTFSYGNGIMPSAKVTDDMVKNICSRTPNSSFCLDVLESDLRVPESLLGLAQFTIDLAHTNATETMKLIQSLIKQTKNPQLKQRYTLCSQNYDIAIGDLDQAKTDLSSRDYGGANVETTGVLNEIRDCEGRFEGAPADPSRLPKRNKDLENICSIILVISNIMSQ